MGARAVPLPLPLPLPLPSRCRTCARPVPWIERATIRSRPSVFHGSVIGRGLMRSRALQAFSFAFLTALAPLPVHADAPAADAIDPTTEARRHFKIGVRLYQDTNYQGALAEFEAAYAAKPGPGSLQNVALCQKALFRYREAAATLDQLLSKHAAELSEGEQKAVRDAIAELI